MGSLSHYGSHSFIYRVYREAWYVFWKEIMKGYYYNQLSFITYWFWYRLLSVISSYYRAIYIVSFLFIQSLSDCCFTWHNIIIYVLIKNLYFRCQFLYIFIFIYFVSFRIKVSISISKINFALGLKNSNSGDGRQN